MRKQTAKPSLGVPGDSRRRIESRAIALTKADLKEVAGGLNPQPLPPAHDDAAFALE